MIRLKLTASSFSELRWMERIRHLFLRNAFVMDETPFWTLDKRLDKLAKSLT